MLRLPYLLNILILLPVCMAMLSGRGAAAVFEDKIDWSRELGLLVGSLWTAILVASALGLIWPKVFAPLLLIQIIYKAIFLFAVVFPLYRAGGSEAVPWGISSTFLLIVTTYPFALWWAWKDGLA